MNVFTAPQTEAAAGAHPAQEFDSEEIVPDAEWGDPLEGESLAPAARPGFRRTTYGLGAAERGRARLLIERLLRVRVGPMAGLRRLARIIARGRGGAVPIDRLEQVWLVRRFVEEGAAELEAAEEWEGGPDLRNRPMQPLKPPGIAMQDAVQRARAYHAIPGWYERYGKVGLHAQTEDKVNANGEAA